MINIASIESIISYFIDEMSSKESLIVALCIVTSALATRIVPLITWAAIKRRRGIMKKIKMVVLVISVIVLFSGCGAMYGSKEQYDKGVWYWYTGSQEVARIEQDKLALKKLEAQQSYAKKVNGVSMGYKGIVYNANREECDIRIYGPETKGFLMPPNMQDTIYLSPGIYTSQSCINGNCGKMSKPFPVSAQTHRFFGQDVHWYVRCDKY